MTHSPSFTNTVRFIKRMIVNQQSNFHWQLVLVTAQDPEIVLRNGLLFLFLTKHFPNVLPSKWYRIDFESLSNQDILGTCLMQRNEKLIAYLKHCCHENMIGNDISDWNKVLNSVSETSTNFFAYAKTISLSTQKRIFINAYMAKR